MVASARALRRTAAREREGALYGCEVPRLWTPPLRKLTTETSLGFAAVDFAAEVCGLELFPWQRWLLIHGLELADGLTVSTMADRDPMDPLFRFRKLVVLVARQNGKSTVSQILALFFLFVLGVELTLGTAQDLDTAEEVWDGCVDIIEETPALAALTDKPVRVNGKKTIRLKSGSRYKVKAANRRAGRGLSGDLIMLDELREHQSWDAWAAITKTAQARPAAQIWTFSNAGDATSVVLRTLRAMAHESLGDPDGINAAEQAAQTPDEFDIDQMSGVGTDVSELEPEDFCEDPHTLGLFEWSAPPGCDVMDRAAWQASNPSMGWGISASTIAGDAVTEGRRGSTEWVFRTEVLCQWPDGGLKGPFPSGAWEATRNVPVDGPDGPEPAPDDRMEPPYVVGIDMSRDRSWTWIARCGKRPDGVDQVELWEARRGVDWVRQFLTAHADEITAITGQRRGAPISDLLDELDDDPAFSIKVVDLDLRASFGVAHDSVRDGTVRHNPQPPLDTAAALSELHYLGDAGVVDRKRSPCDAAPLVAWVNALWLARQPVTHPGPVPFPVVAAPVEAPTGTIWSQGF